MASYVYKDSSLQCVSLGMDELVKVIDFYVPVKFTAEEKVEFGYLVAERHSHNNKDILDKLGYDEDTNNLTYNGEAVHKEGLTSDEVDFIVDQKITKLGNVTEEEKKEYKAAVEKAHEHKNKEILDKFDYDSVNGRVMYDGTAMTGSGMLQNEVESLVQEKISNALKEYGNSYAPITSTEKSDYDQAVINTHTHNNFGVLEAISYDDTIGKLTYNGDPICKGLEKQAVSDLIDETVPIKLKNHTVEEYDQAVEESHTHYNNDALDRFSYNNGKLFFNGKEISFVDSSNPDSGGSDSSQYKTMTAIIDLTDSNPATCVSYADDAVGMTAGDSAWDEFFGHYPVLLKNGVEVGKLNPNNFDQFEDGTTADISSGNAGDAMIAFPRRGLTIKTVENKVYVSMTNDPNNADFEYNAHTRGTTAKDVFYLGVYKGYTSSDKLRSLKRKTITNNQTIETFRTQAQANGDGYEQSGFYQLTFRQCMYILKYKNLDSQAAVGYGCVSSNLNGVMQSGGTETWGMDCEEIEKTNPSYMTDKNHHVKCFGLEDFWGNISEWIDGIFIDSSRNVLTANSGFNDSGSGYTNNGNGGVSTNIGNYMSKPQGSTKAGFVVKEVNASQTTYFCDSANLLAVSGMRFGGFYNEGDRCGVFNLVANDISTTGAHVGARLMYL